MMYLLRINLKAALKTAIGLVLFLVLINTMPFTLAQSSLKGIKKSDGDTGTTAAENIAVDDIISDDAIMQRLMEVYDSKENLKNIQVKVDAGIVTLTGTTNSSEAHQSAVELASRMEGVVDITDEISESYDLSDRIKTLNERFSEIFNEFIEKFPVFAFALFVFLIFCAIASAIFRFGLFFRTFIKNPFLRVSVRHLLRILVIFLGFVIALEIIEATAVLGTLLGALGIFGLAVSFAIRDTIENYIASILLSLRQPFNANDHVLINEHEGNVVTLTTRETILLTADGNHVRIPNAMVYKGIIVNYTRNPYRRFSFSVGVGATVGLTGAQSLAVETLLDTPGVADEPQPSSQIEEIGDSSIVLLISGWTDQRFYDFQKVKSEAIHSIKTAFDNAGYEMPEPIYQVKLQSSLADQIADHVAEERPDSDRKISPADGQESVADVKKDSYIDKQIELENKLATEDNLLEK